MTRKTPFILLLTLLAACMLTLSPASQSRAEDAAVEAASDAHTAGHDDHGERGPIPKPEHAIAPAVTTLIVFALLVAVLAKYAWGPIATGLKAREDKIRRDIEDAEAARARAEATLKEYSARLAAAEQQVRDMLDKATVQGEQIATNLKMQAQQDAESTRERALRDIDEARKQAVGQIYEQAATLATTAAEKIIRRNLNPDDHRDLVNQSLEQLQTINGRNN